MVAEIGIPAKQPQMTRPTISRAFSNADPENARLKELYLRAGAGAPGELAVAASM